MCNIKTNIIILNHKEQKITRLVQYDKYNLPVGCVATIVLIIGE